MQSNATSTRTGTAQAKPMPKSLVTTPVVNESTLRKHDKTINVLSSEIKFLQSQRLETVNEIIADILALVKTDKHLAEMTGKAKKRRTAMKLYKNGISSKELSPYSKRALSAAGKLIELNLLDSFKWRLFPLSKLELVLRTNENFIKRLHKAQRNKDNEDYIDAFIAEIKSEAQVTIKSTVKKYDTKKLGALK